MKLWSQAMRELRSGAPVLLELVPRLQASKTPSQRKSCVSGQLVAKWDLGCRLLPTLVAPGADPGLPSVAVVSELQQQLLQRLILLRAETTRQNAR